MTDFPLLTEGHITSPNGPSPGANGNFFSCSRQNIMMGRVKTSVFPEPVNAIPIISLPDKLGRGGGEKIIYLI